MNLNKKLILFSTLTTVVVMFILTFSVNRTIKSDRREQIWYELQQQNQMISEYCVQTNTIEIGVLAEKSNPYISTYVIGNEEVNVMGNSSQNSVTELIPGSDLTSLAPNQFHEVTSNSKLWIIYVSKILINSNTYTVATVICDENILALTRKITTVVTIIATLSCIAMALLLSVVVNKLIRPFQPILEGVQNFSEKKFEQLVEVDTNDEFKVLAEQLNKMAGDLKRLDMTEKKFYEDYSHDIKTPLTVISSYIEGLRTGVITDREKTYLLVENECVRLKKYIENMIYLSKLETSDHSANWERIELNRVISDSLVQMDSLIILSDLDIDFEATSKLWVNGNKEQLQRAFANVFSNCIRYAKSVIHIKCEETADGIVVSICDDGEGFPQNVLDSPFSRNRNGQKSGSGIGLSIINKIITMHGGTLTLSNLENGGASYFVLLPKSCHK